MWIGLRYDHFNHYIMVDIYPAWISHYFCLAKFEKSPSTLEDWSLIQSYSSSLPNQHLCSCLCMYTVVCLHPPPNTLLPGYTHFFALPLHMLINLLAAGMLYFYDHKWVPLLILVPERQSSWGITCIVLYFFDCRGNKVK